jgi:Mg-chelatase subunit ChlD
MNPDFPKDERAAFEASLTALLLGELPHDQAAALHQKLAQDAELAKLYERLKQTINLVRETLASPAAQTADQPAPLRLTEQRRQMLLKHFKTVAPVPFIPIRRRRMPWLVPVGIAAAFVVILGGLFLPALSRTKSKGESFAFRTFSASEPAVSATLARPAQDSTRSSEKLMRRLDQASSGLENVREGKPIALSLQQATPTAKPAAAAIVLPRSLELADAATTSAGAEGVQLGFTASGTTRGFYDDSLGRTGGMGGGGGFGGGGLGGAGGGLRGDSMGTEVRQKELAAAAERERLQAAGEPPPVVAESSGQTLEFKANGIVPTVGPDGALLPSAPQSQDFAFRARYGLAREAAKGTGAGTGAGSTARPNPNNATVGDDFFAQSAETRKEANMEAAPSAALPVLGATLAAAPEAQAQAATTQPAPGAAPAAAEPALAANSVAMASVPSQDLFQRNNAPKEANDQNALFGQSAQSAKDNLAPEPAAATLLARSTVAQQVEPKQAPVVEGRPTPSGGYYGGGAYGGYSSIQKLPSGGNQGAAPARPALRSPKEGRLAGGVGGAATPPPPTGLPEAAVNEAALRQANIDLSKLSDQQALGFDWYLGNSLAGKSQLAAKDSTAPAKAGQAAVEGKQVEELAKRSEPAPAFKGTPSDLPVLGEVPAAGRLFRSAPVAAAGNVQLNSGSFTTGQTKDDMAGLALAPALTEEKVKSTELADFDGELKKGAAEAQQSRPDSRGANVHSMDVVGHADVALTATNAIAGFPIEPSTTERYSFYRLRSQLGTDLGKDASGASSPAQSSIVLPPAPETSPALKGGRDVQLLAAANKSAATPATLDDPTKTKPYFEAKRSLEEAQRFRQIVDMKIASEKIDVELPKTMMVEIVDKAVPPSSPTSTLWDKISGKRDGFKSTARIKIDRDAPDISGIMERGGNTPYDPYFVQTESEVIQSEAVLGKVIKDLNLNGAWGKKHGDRALTTAETMALLKNKLDLRTEQNTSLIDIGVKSDKPEEAAEIANAVAEEYKAYRAEQRARLSKSGIQALEERRAEQDKKIASAKAEVERLGREAKESTGKQADLAPSKLAAPAPIPQPEVQTADSIFSTFSLNVSDVSFKLAAASLEKGMMPEPATVRSEEFINAFDYRDPEPPPGVPVAFAWERAQYPFAQNRDLLRFSIKTAAQGRQPGRPLNLVLLLDNSGSMERADRVRIIHEALRVLAGQLQPQDLFSVVNFSRTAHLWVDGVPGNRATQMAEEVSGLTPEGGTNLEDAMDLAYLTALRHYLASGINRVVLLTDGAANLGNVDPEALKQKVETNRKQGVALDCFGIGWEGYNDDLLEVLSRNGDGRYAFLNTPEEATSEFAAKLAGALQVAASDVKVQVEFNPARVTAYRQIGYAKHQLTKEQFRDNSVNAAQIGAAEAGNALYAVEVNPAGTGPLCTVRVRFRIPGTTDYREHAWDVPFTGGAVALEQASPAMRLAATASALSEWLASSPYTGEVTTDRLLGYLSGVPEVYGADARPKKLEWMIRQAKSISGK